MYAEFYGLREAPFNITPDPRFLYLNDCYQEALAALTYGIDERKGFVSLVGEAGMGKTTMLRRLLDTLSPSTRTVLLLNPTVPFEQILEHILLELGVPPEGGKKLVLLQRLNEFLIEHTRSGGNVALLIDEAQDLSPAVLEELRLLSNLETAREKILQIVLAGQPELDRVLADPALRQLRQRVTLRIRIRPLSPPEVASYVRSRLERAGASNGELFTPDALVRIAELAQGIPRVVNVLCDAALLAGLATGSRQVSAAIVDEAWRDYAPETPAITTAPSLPVRPALPPSPVAAEVVPVAPGAPEVQEFAAAVASDVTPAVQESAAPAPNDAPSTAAAASAPVVTDVLAERSRVVQPPPAPAPSPRPPSPPRASATASPSAGKRPGATPAAKPRGPFGIPVAAALVAVLVVAVSVVSFERDNTGPDVDTGDADTAVATSTPGIAGVIEATAAEPPVVAEPPPAPSEARTPPVPAREPAPSVGATPLSPVEAAALIDEFRAAYEARDVERLIGLFAADASANGVRGLDAIDSMYRANLPNLSEVRYTMPRFSVEPRRAGADVRAPFVITYRKASGDSGEIRGQAEWQLERRQGRPRIIALDYRLDPQS
jgi:general secretion pathway protein A